MFFYYIIVANGVSIFSPMSLHYYLIGGIGTKGSVWLFFKVKDIFASEMKS
jgi:hypothetical protein